MTYQTFRSACGDVGLLMALVFLVPVTILVIGTPIALCVRAVIFILGWR